MQENNGLKSILNQTEIASINSIADIENIKIDKEKFNKLNTKKEQATNEYIFNLIQKSKTDLATVVESITEPTTASRSKDKEVVLIRFENLHQIK